MIRSVQEVWAPRMLRGDAEAFIAKILPKPRRYRASTLSRLLGLTKQEHELGSIQSIRPLGVTDADMKDRKLKRERERKRNKRRSEGVVSREEWLAANSKSRAEPWKPLGISKPTYYRWLKAGKIPQNSKRQIRPLQ